MAPSAPPFIHIDNVTYTHWNQTTPSLKRLSLDIQRGSFNVLVGPGGSGKSTLCSLFNGEIPHLLSGELEGTVLVDGADTRQAEVKDLARQVGHVFQDPETMFTMLYVEDEIAFGPENLRIAPGEIRQTVEQVLATIQLLPQRHHLVWNLSGGQIQKLGLGVILAMQPDMIVLDEPTANLDPLATRSVHELIADLRNRGVTIVLVTRELDDFILSTADQLIVLRDGSVLASGPVQAVIQSMGPDGMDALGIWLPETVEIGLALQKRLGLSLDPLPITVAETLTLLRQHAMLPAELTMQASGPVNAPASQGETLISATHLAYAYDNQAQALKGVSFDVHAGEMLAIVGRNGAGKSTLAQLLVGLLKPQAGALTLFGRPAQRWKVEDLSNHIALVFQNPEHQFLTDTVHDEIAYSLLARGITRPGEVEQSIDEMLRLLELENVREVHPFALSAGLKRRLGVATMLVARPQVLLVDEPTYGQDKQMTHTLMALMEAIRAQGVTVVIITHDMRLVQEYTRRVIVMSEGLILYDGSPAGLFASDEMLLSASLRPTLLQELLRAYEAGGGRIEGEIRTTEDFLSAILAHRTPEDAHGLR